MVSICAIKNLLKTTNSINELTVFNSLVFACGNKDLFTLYTEREYECGKEFTADGTLSNTIDMCNKAGVIREVRYRFVDANFIIYPLPNTVKITFFRCYGIVTANLHDNVQYLVLEDSTIDCIDLSMFPRLKLLWISDTFVKGLDDIKNVINYKDFQRGVMSTTHCKIETFYRIKL